MSYEEAAEYHRGYVDGRRARAAQEWQLENERQIVVNRLQSLDLNDGSHENLSKICRAIYNASQGWTKEACEELIARLTWLLGSETGSKVDYVASVKELLDIVVLNAKDAEDELIKKLYILSLTSMASFDHARDENDKLRKLVRDYATFIALADLAQPVGHIVAARGKPTLSRDNLGARARVLGVEVPS